MCEFCPDPRHGGGYCAVCGSRVPDQTPKLHPFRPQLDRQTGEMSGWAMAVLSVIVLALFVALIFIINR